jgi:hypothetical protein
MKGFPPLEIVLILLLFGAALVPLVKLTGDRVVAHGTPEEVADETTATFATLRLSVIPEQLVISLAGQPLLEEPIKDNEVDFEFEASEDGADLEILGRFPEGSAPVLEITVEPDALASQSQTIWLETNEVDETVTFNW